MLQVLRQVRAPAEVVGTLLSSKTFAGLPAAVLEERVSLLQVQACGPAAFPPARRVVAQMWDMQSLFPAARHSVRPGAAHQAGCSM